MRSGRDRRIGVLIGVFVSRSVAVSLVPPCLPALAERYGVSYAGVGGLMATFFAAYTLSVLVASTWGRGISRRALLVLGAGLQVLASLGLGWAQTYEVARLAAVAFGLGGLSDLMATAILADLGGRSSGRLLSWAHGGFALGAVVVPLLAGLALDAGIAVPRLFLASAAVNLGMLVLVAALRDVEPSEGRAPAGTVRRLVRSGTFRAGMGVLFLYILAEVVATVWLPTWIAERFQARVSLASSALSLFWATMLVGRLVSAPFVDRLPPRRLLAWTAGAAAVAYCAMLLAPNSELAFGGVIAVGLSLACMVPVLQSLIVRQFPGVSVQVLGLFGLASGLAGAVSPWLVGRVAEGLRNHGLTTPGHALAWAMGLAPLAMAALLALLPALRPGPDPRG